jgi:hypothetical protein
LEWGKKAQKDKKQQQHCSNTKLRYLSGVITMCCLNMKSMGTRLTAHTESSGLPSGDCFFILSSMGALFLQNLFFESDTRIESPATHG